MDEVDFILYTRRQSPEGEGGEMIIWGYAENDFYIINNLWH